LHNLAIINEDIDVNPKLTYIPIEDSRICRLKHELLLRQLFHNLGHDIRPPALHVLRDALTLDYKAFDASIEESLAEINELGRVGCANAGEFRSGDVAASVELDAEFGLGFEAVGVLFVDETESVVAWEGKEAGGELDDVEAVEGNLSIRPTCERDGETYPSSLHFVRYFSMNVLKSG
jgi:hypothetical protein